MNIPNGILFYDCSNTRASAQKKQKTKTQHGQNTHTHTYMRTHAHRVSYLDLNGHKLAYYVLLGLEQRFSLIVPFFVCALAPCPQSRGRSLPETDLTFLSPVCPDLVASFTGTRLHFLLPVYSQSAVGGCRSLRVFFLTVWLPVKRVSQHPFFFFFGMRLAGLWEPSAGVLMQMHGSRGVFALSVRTQ